MQGFWNSFVTLHGLLVPDKESMAVIDLIL